MSAKVYCDNPECEAEADAQVVQFPPFVMTPPATWCLLSNPDGTVVTYCSEACQQAAEEDA